MRSAKIPNGMTLLRTALGLSLLLFQIGAILYARFVPARYFCWAPYDMQTDYELQVMVDGRTLTPAEIRGRYRRGAKGTDNRSAQHVIDIVQGVEERRREGAEVVMRYRVNGGEKRTWQWPPR
jgi:hypothetical protein